MDPFAPAAAQPPVAAETQPTGAIQQPVDPAQQPTQGLTDTQVASSPPAAGTPESPTPSPDSQRLAEIEAQLSAERQQRQQLEQTFAQLQQMAQQQQQQQMEAQQQQAAAERLNNVYQMAANMTPEDGFQFIRRHEDQERAANAARIQQVQAMEQQRTMEIAARIAAPLYAQTLVKQHNLPPEYAERLAMVTPQQMDAFVPFLKQQHEEGLRQQQAYKELAARIDQSQRSDQAQQLGANGAHVVGGAGFSPSGGTGQPLNDGSIEHLLQNPKFAQMFFGQRPN